MTDHRTVETLAELLRDAIEVVHETEGARRHHDPSDKTGWNVHGIETCEDALCVASLEALAALPATPAGPPRGKVFIRTPDETQEWTAWGDVVPGIPYQYISGGFIVRVELTAAEPREGER